MKIDEFLKKKIGFISLGCDKNRVDLEKMIFNIKNFGLTIVNNPSEANIIIVNTCSFLESARLESIETILEMSDYKSNNLEKLIVTGCLNELNYPDLQESMPEVDKFVNIKDNEQIVPILASLYNIQLNYNYTNDRVLTTPNHYAYLKISEGCNNFCTYCLIPYIRGRYKSTPIEELIKEAQSLLNRGVKEIILVAQDVTKYGIDIYNKKSLVTLIQELSKLNGLEWIRLLYCYPEEIDDDLINEIKKNPKVLKYIDIPLQHVSDNILKAMNRRSTYKSTCLLFNKLIKEIPNIFIRTTFIIGFPGETKDDFNQIIKFIKEYKLDNVGFFAYSREEGTKAYNLENQIDDVVKQNRVDIASQEQYEIQKIKHNNLIGKDVNVIIDSIENGISIGRFYGQSPLIDSVVYIDEILEVGQIVKIKLIEKLDYDFKGERIWTFQTKFQLLEFA